MKKAPRPRVLGPYAEIPGDRRSRTEPLCWTWDPPDDAQWEYARKEERGVMPGEITEQESGFILLVRWCRYRCAICGMSGLSDPLVMDHDHSTGWCRGVLCRSCNRIEGFGGGSLFAMYRERTPADICGVKVWYTQASLCKASPEIVDFYHDLRFYSWTDADRRPRQGRPWLVSEERIASRSDLTDEEVARIIGRTPQGVAARRRTLTIDLPDVHNWW